MIPKMLTFEEYHNIHTWGELEDYHFGASEDTSIQRWMWNNQKYNDTTKEEEYQLYVEWYELEFSPLGRALR